MLKSDNATMKGDKALLQKNHDEQAASISVKDKELREANDLAFSAMVVKAQLEE